MKLIAGLAVAGLMAASPIHAQQTNFGDWRVQSTAAGIYIAGIEINGSEGLVVFCPRQTNCTLVVAMDGTCRTGQETDMLLNNGAFVVSKTFTCNRIDGDDVWATEWIDEFEELFGFEGQQRNSLSIAKAETDGGFMIRSFSLYGSREAINYAEDRSR